MLEYIPVSMASGPENYIASRQDGPPGANWWGARLGDLDLDVDAGGQFQALQGVDRLGGVLHDVQQPLVDPHLEVLPAVLVLVGGANHGVAVLVRGEGDGPPHLGLGAQHGLHDLLGRLVDDLVVVGLEPYADLLPAPVGHGST